MVWSLWTKMIKMSIWKSLIWFIEFNLSFFQLQGQHNLLRQPWPPSHCKNEIFEFTTDDEARENPWKKAVTGSKQLLPGACGGLCWQPMPSVVAQPQAPEAGAAQTPFLGLLPSCCVSSGTWTYRLSPLEKECISQIPIKASRALACFIISSSLRPFWDLECGKLNRWPKPSNLSC